MAWYKDFFEKWYLDIYHSAQIFKPSYIKKGVSFIKEILNLGKGVKILDLCCGQGRHLVPLAKMGYRMTGLDLSKKALALLEKELRSKKIKARIIRSDMRKIPFKNEFDAVINMFTSFGYLENDYENLRVLKAVNKALKPGGKFLIDVINRDWLINGDRLSRNFSSKHWDKRGNLLILEERNYDFKTKRQIVKIWILDKKGKWHKTAYSLRLYSLSEMRNNLNKVGFKIIKVYGSTVEKQKFTKNSHRLVILARKK